MRKSGYVRGWRCRGSSGERKLCYCTIQNKPTEVRDFAGRSKGKQPIFKRTLGKTEIFVVTCAQNATPRHKGFYAALEQYCQHRSAQLLVIPTRYRNPTSRWTKMQEEQEHWDVPKEHLLNTRLKLNRNIEVLGDIKVQPTAVNPLTGFEAVTSGESGILGHTKLQLSTIATPQDRLPKILTTTGACTLSNYTDSKAGKLGEFHHTLGACVVEVRGAEFHLRQINGQKTTGEFYDLELLYGAGSKPGPCLRPLGLDMGDTHVRAIDKGVEHATFKEMVPQLQPRALVWHDLCDGYAFNHHAVKNPFVPIEREAIGASDVREEVLASLRYLEAHTPADVQSILVPSNHNDFLQRWLQDTDWRFLDPVNRLFYLQTANALAQEAVKGDGFQAERLNAFIYWAKIAFEGKKNLRVLEYDESCMLGGIEVGLHGHQGPNGARGSLKNLRRIGVKTVTGHSHSPGIDEGAYRVGTSTRLRLGYNIGPSSWLNTHCLIYGNGKRTLLNIIDGKWRL
jgi:hypothetical protein